MNDEEELEVLRKALRQERGQIEDIEIKNPQEEELAKAILVTMRNLGPEAASIFLKRLRAMGSALIRQRSMPPGTIAADLPVVDALSLAVALLIDRTPEGPVLHDYASMEEAVATFLSVLER